MQRTRKSVDKHLDSLGGDMGHDIRRLDTEIRKRIGKAERHLYEGKFWGGSDQRIVGYGVVDYSNSKGEPVEWFMVGLAQQKSHISMYVNAVEDGNYLLRDYEGKLGKAKVGSAVISFDSIEKIDLDNLLELVERAGDQL